MLLSRRSFHVVDLLENCPCAWGRAKDNHGEPVASDDAAAEST